MPSSSPPVTEEGLHHIESEPVARAETSPHWCQGGPWSESPKIMEPLLGSWAKSNWVSVLTAGVAKSGSLRIKRRLL